MRQDAIQKWPGNNIRTFKKNSHALEELEELVDQLEKECTFEPAGFNRKGIKQHVLDVLNERRRHLRNGHDYTKVSLYSKTDQFTMLKRTFNLSIFAFL